MFKVTNRNGSVFGNEPYICEFVCDTTSDVPTLPTSISEGTGGKTKYDNQLCSSGSIATVIDNGSNPKKYILDNRNTWCPYSVSSGSSISAESVLASSKEYTDSEIADLINGAPTTLDTLKEIADAITENQTVIDALDTAIYSKANKTDIPTKMSQLENDSGYLTEHQDLSDYALKSLYGDTTINVGRLTNSTVGDYSTAEGYGTTASGNNSHAEGAKSKASGTQSHAEGWNATASGDSSHAEGGNTTASGTASHAEGSSTTASGQSSHAEGDNTIVTGNISHAEGYRTTASGDCSHAEGIKTTASNYASHACGHYNAAMINGGLSNNTVGTAFVIGNGTNSSELSNAFSVQYDGIVKAKSTITASTTADYAEFFEWIDGNPDNDDRIGYFVTLDGDKIRIATNEDDYILGVVSGEPFVLGNGDCDTWNGMFLRDEFRRTIYEPAPKMVEILDSEGNPTGEFEEVDGEFEGTRPKLNPEYDNTQPYISRFDRKEWAPVGMLGVLSVRHDGTAQVNGYVTVNADGIATACDKNTENSYRVIKANSDTVVEIIFR